MAASSDCFFFSAASVKRSKYVSTGVFLAIAVVAPSPESSSSVVVADACAAAACIFELEAGCVADAVAAIDAVVVLLDSSFEID